MSQLGRWQSLQVEDIANEGAYLAGGELGEVFLKKALQPTDLAVGDNIEVFVYLDNAGLPVATTQKPAAQVGDFALLTVTQINRVGAFLNWGLEKDVLAPFNEQKPRMQQGNAYLVKLYLDNASQRICASSNLNKFVGKQPVTYRQGEEVNLIVAGKTDLGVKVIVDETHWGLVFANNVFKKLLIGQRLTGYVSKSRDDNKLDIVLEKPGIDKIEPLKQRILTLLEQNNGYLGLGDKSAPELIKKQLATSKANYKKAIGGLFKDGLIDIEATAIKKRD